MRVFKHPKTGMLHIWTISIYGETFIERYIYYTQKEAIKKFREKYPAWQRKLKGVEKTNYCPFLFD